MTLCSLLLLAAQNLISPIVTSDAGATTAVDPAVNLATISASVLQSAMVVKSTGTPHVKRMTDGNACTDGDTWDSERTAKIEKVGVVEWDLGSFQELRVARIQADNNDRYLIATSKDGVTFTPLWVAGPVDLPGVQTRTSPEFRGVYGRFIRLQAEGGDGLFSVGEFEIFNSPEAMAASPMKRLPLPPPPPQAPTPPFDTAMLIVTAVGLYGVYFFYDARRQNQARQKAPESEHDPKTK
jgi:hypothetical protein